MVIDSMALIKRTRWKTGWIHENSPIPSRKPQPNKPEIPALWRQGLNMVFFIPLVSSYCKGVNFEERVIAILSVHSSGMVMFIFMASDTLWTLKILYLLQIPLFCVLGTCPSSLLEVCMWISTGTSSSTCIRPYTSCTSLPKSTPLIIL